MNEKDVEFCKCENDQGVYSESNDFGWWYRCCKCNKVIEDSFEYYSNDMDIDF